MIKSRLSKKMKKLLRLEHSWTHMLKLCPWPEKTTTSSVSGVKFTNSGVPDRSALSGVKGDYILHCDLCSAEIVKIEKSAKALIISSPLRRFQVIVAKLELVLSAIEKRDLAYLHKMLYDADGLDFYCPDCDRLYCEKHYFLFPKWEGTFYDFTEGTCPKGHVRIVDD